MEIYGRSNSKVWGLLLAGGDGTRLQPLTRVIEGDARPKQFCRLMGEESLVRQTLRRINTILPLENIVAVVSKKHEVFYIPELGALRHSWLVVQPENRGTGIAIAAAILTVRQIRPDDVIVLFPCDHYYQNEAAFFEALDLAIQAARLHADSVVLLGAEPSHPETDYGWIEPEEGSKEHPRLSVARVRQIWEKPARVTAEALLNRGCLWNTFVVTGRADTFLDLLSMAAPKTMFALSAGAMARDLAPVYGSVSPVDFSHDVLGRQPHRLLVVRDKESGWTDLGRPERVFDAITRHRKVTRG